MYLKKKNISNSKNKNQTNLTDKEIVSNDINKLEEISQMIYKIYCNQ